MAIVRETVKIDNKGRILIPKRVKEVLGFKQGMEFDLEITKVGSLVLRKSKPLTKYQEINLLETTEE